MTPTGRTSPRDVAFKPAGCGLAFNRSCGRCGLRFGSSLGGGMFLVNSGPEAPMPHG